jgi:hypothetical protein
MKNCQLILGRDTVVRKVGVGEDTPIKGVILLAGGVKAAFLKISKTKVLSDKTINSAQ